VIAVVVGGKVAAAAVALLFLLPLLLGLHLHWIHLDAAKFRQALNTTSAQTNKQIQTGVDRLGLRTYSVHKTKSILG